MAKKVPRRKQVTVKKGNGHGLTINVDLAKLVFITFGYMSLLMENI